MIYFKALINNYMKKISLTLMAFLAITVAFAQTSPLNASIDVNIPANAVKVNRQQAFSISKQRIPGSLEDSMPGTVREQYFYNIDDIILELYPSENGEVVDPDIIAKRKAGSDDHWKKKPSYSATVKTINRNQVLTMYHESKAVGNYNFLCLSPDGKRYLSGGFKFKISDHEKAIALAERFFSGLRFK
jgi:hypothetical protein